MATVNLIDQMVSINLFEYNTTELLLKHFLKNNYIQIYLPIIDLQWYAAWFDVLYSFMLHAVQPHDPE